MTNLRRVACSSGERTGHCGRRGAVDDPVYHGIGSGLHPAEYLLVFGTGWCVVVGVFCVEVVLDEYIPGPGPVHIVQVFAPRP